MLRQELLLKEYAADSNFCQIKGIINRLSRALPKPNLFNANYKL